MDNDILKVCLVLYFSLGIAFAFAELVELLTHKLVCFFMKVESEHRGRTVCVYSFLVIFLWPFVLLSLIIQIFFKKTYARIRQWIERKVLETGRKQNGNG